MWSWSLKKYRQSSCAGELLRYMLLIGVFLTNTVHCSNSLLISFYIFLLPQGGKRSDGRTPDGIRPIDSRCGLLPRAHGSSLFTRGETQVKEEWCLQGTSCVAISYFDSVLLPIMSIFVYDSFRHWQLLLLVINKWRKELTTLRVLMNTRGFIFRSLQYFDLLFTLAIVIYR